MAGDVTLTRLLLGFGLRQFSMHPAHLLSVKQVVLKSDLVEVAQLARRMLRVDDPDKLYAAARQAERQRERSIPSSSGATSSASSRRST